MCELFLASVSEILRRSAPQNDKCGCSTKTLRITREHFAQLYDNVPDCFYRYDSGNLARVCQFAASNDRCSPCLPCALALTPPCRRHLSDNDDIRMTP